MADENISQNSSEAPKPKSNWKRVTQRYEPTSSGRRLAALATVMQSGYTSLTAGGVDILANTAIVRGIEPTKEFMVDMSTDEERGLVSVWATQIASPGTVSIRLSKSGATTKISFHMGGAFVQAPSLRPSITKKRCNVGTEIGEDGLPVLTIALTAGKAKITQHRDATE